ncbi:hypothetical protein EUGRSUZ_H04184 [Eucalyptus grandis]|uniref:Uncharacterized protein n=2 Tax=Eucalyptus grandis TaxID=71139 RepID=A0ACC3JWX6_EUCGR|nr:hypothetical protein EUGRSUZ_H04184 [Eucalyptus grandis]
MNFDGETAVGGDAIAAVLMGVGHSNLVTMRMTAFLEPITEVHVITFLGHCILDGQIRLFNQLFIGVPAVPVGMHVRHSHFTTLPVPMVPAPVAPAPVVPPDEDLPAGANIPADDFLEGILANGL